MLLALAPALAHPGADGRLLVGHRLDLSLGSAEVHVRHVVELPQVRLDPASPPEALLRTLPHEVALSWEGAPLAPRWTDGEIAEGESGYVELSWEGTAERPAGEGTLRAHDTSLPGEQAVFAASVRIDGSLVVTQTSLATVQAGRAVRNRDGAWLAGEDAREVVVRVRPARPWEAAEGSLPLGARLAGTDALAFPVVPSLAGLGAAFVVLAVARRARRRRTGG